MPLYPYKCPKCRAELDVFRPMADSDKPWKCTDCGGTMKRAFNSQFMTGGKDYSRAIVSDSLAMHPDQILEHKKRFPGIEVTPDGRPVFDNYTKHNKYLKDINMVKQPQKIRPRGHKKATTK